jgi:hypothetical protein
MEQHGTTRRIETMVAATAKAMALAAHRCGTPRMVKLYVDDARQVLRDVAKAARRQNWSLDELILVLDPPKHATTWRERREGPPLHGEP